MVHTLDQQHQNLVSAQLEQTIKRLEASSDPQASLLIEHLQTAEAMLLGSMPEESRNNLELARAASYKLNDRDLRTEVTEGISGMIAAMAPPLQAQHHPHERPVSSEPTGSMEAFFRGSDVRFGIFYPKKFIVAVFWSFEMANNAAAALRSAGFADRDVIAVSGTEVLEHLEQLRSETGLWGQLMREVSRFLDTEENLIDHYASWAKRGAAFVAVYSPEEEDSTKANEVLIRFEPVAAHWYTANFIRTLPIGNA